MIFEYVANLLMLLFIFEIVDDINGWSKYEILFLYSFNLIGYSLWSCFFIHTISLPYYIRNGSFDRFLIRPVDPLFQIAASGFDEDSWGEIIFGIILLIFSSYHLKIRPIMYLLMPIFFASGCLIYASMSILFSTISFYSLNKGNFANLVMELKDFAQYPLTIYNSKLRVLFSTILPIGFVAFYPSSLFLNNSRNYWLILLIPLFSYLYFKFCKFIWNIGLKKYSSSGS